MNADEAKAVASKAHWTLMEENLDGILKDIKFSTANGLFETSIMVHPDNVDHLKEMGYQVVQAYKISNDRYTAYRIMW